MAFIHYKDQAPVNLDKVGTIAKENQEVAPGTKIFAVSFLDFERKVGYWIFQTDEERNKVYDMVRDQHSRPVQKAKKEIAPQPTFVR